MDRHFLLRRLHSLTGLFPIGAFMMFHLFINSFAVKGAANFTTGVRFIHFFPYLRFMEIGILAVPILYHGIYGIYIVWTGQANAGRYTYVRNWSYVLQRITGVMAFVYLVLHVSSLTITNLLGGVAERALTETPFLYNQMANYLASPAIFGLYLIGVFACCFHFFNGLWSFSITWGLLQSERTQRLASYAFNAVGLVVYCYGVNSLLAFRGIHLIG